MMELMEWRYLAHSQPTIVTEPNSRHMTVLELKSHQEIEELPSFHALECYSIDTHTCVCTQTNTQVHMQINESFLRDKLYKL